MISPSNVLLLVALCAGLAAVALAVAWRRTASVTTGRRLELSLSPVDALAAAEAAFAPADWTPTEGDGAINRAHRRPGRPGISVEAVAAPGGSEVHVWMSGWSLLLGAVRYAGVAQAQFAAVETALLAAAEAYEADPTADVAPAASEAVPALNFSAEVVRTIHALSSQRAGRPAAREHAAA